MKHLENFLSVSAIKGTVETYEKEVAVLVDQLRDTPPSKGDGKSRERLARIRLQLAKANRAFAKRNYQKALDEYKKLQGLIYNLIQPSFIPILATNPIFAAPLEAELFEPLLNRSLEMVAKIEPEPKTTGFGGGSFLLPDAVKKSMEPLSDLGVKTEHGFSSELTEIAEAGTDYLEQGDHQRALEFFELAAKSLDGNDSEEGKLAAASMQMNIGVALLQAGRTEESLETLNAAAKGYSVLGDLVGQAQVKTNQAALAQKTGNPKEAEVLLMEADQLLARAEGLPEQDGFSSSNGTPEGTPSEPGGYTRTPFTRSFLSGISRPIISRPVMSVGSSDGGSSLSLAGTTMTVATPVAEAFVARPAVDPEALTQATQAEGQAVVLRQPGKSEGWVVQALVGNIENANKAENKVFSMEIAGEKINVPWKVSKGIDNATIKSKLYEKRIDAQTLNLVNFRFDLDSDLSARLPHLYYFSIPVKMGDCYKELGEYDLAITSYKKASDYQYINKKIEIPSVWIRIAETALDHGDLLFRQGDPTEALKHYGLVMTLEEEVPDSDLYKGPLKIYGDKVEALIDNMDDADNSVLNPKLIGLVFNIRSKTRMIKAGLNFWGLPANYFPIFKFDYLHSVATHFAQQAVQAEREYINFTARGEDEELTRQQIEQSVEAGKAEVKLAEEQLEYAKAEEKVTQENKELAELRRHNAIDHKQDVADAAYEQAALDAAMQFAGGPEGYEVNYTYYSPSEGKNVTLSGSDAYKVMSEAAYRRGMISRDLELANIQRQIDELQQNIDLAEAQNEAAQARTDISEQQLEMAKMNQRHSEDLLETFNDQIFTPEVWYQLGNHMRYISASYMNRALNTARKMEMAYELETGFDMSVIKSSYTTNIASGLLSADYLLKDIEYFTYHRIMQSKAKDIAVKQEFSLNSINPTGFASKFKETGILEFDTSLAEFDRAFPGTYLRKIKKVEVVVEGLLPPGGIVGTLKNSGISRDRKKNGNEFFRLQPREALLLSEFSPRNDLAIFQPNPSVLGVFEHCGTATSWTLEIPPSANDIDFNSISDVRMIVYYTAQHNPILETQIKGSLPTAGKEGVALPFRLLYPDAYYKFIDGGEMEFDLRTSDFAYNQEDLQLNDLAVRIVRHDGLDPAGITLKVETDGKQASGITDEKGTVKSDPHNPAPLDLLQGVPVTGNWRISAPEADNVDLERSSIRDIFLFVDYSFKYRGV
ncbi:Tc toxin subunit A-related protein [Flexibacterium corallicola]|uniref:Tc toxin subunit A-related protein n=1 Tax=Flexibacterium corallicola TaxID=3037259 RepID=UPI00286F421F|nr:hypothetical protein [Pseudovibrio sp. M1P-2-3]